MKAITLEWLNHAETDLLTCKEIIKNEQLTNIVAFHAQQTVEKCFKAIIEENNVKVPRIHSLIRLFNKIETITNFTINEDKIKILDRVYTETRYPSDIGMLPDGKPSIAEAKKLYEFAEYIFTKTKKMLSDNNKPKD